jgi:hypothetical protein
MILIPVILLIILLNKTNKNAEQSKASFNKLQSAINELQVQIKNNTLVSSQPTVVEEKFDSEIIPEIMIPRPIVPKEVIPEIQEEIIKEEQEDVLQKVAYSSQSLDILEEELPKPTPKIIQERKIIVPEKSWLEKFKENNPDIEKFIGENLINKIGILILVLGISFFVKYAIDKDWINELARVGIGILAGAIVMLVAHKLKANYKSFSSVFVAGAVGIFYLTIGIAFHDYQLFSQTMAFLIMVFITAFSAFVSVSYDRKELAVLTLIGGFAVPFMVSTGSGNYTVLFSYLIILNLGMLTIAYFKKWNLVTILAFIFTSCIYSAWFQSEYVVEKLPHSGAFIFATAFYIIFSIAIVINNLRNKNQFSKIDYALLLANTFFYFGIGLTIIDDGKTHMKGLYTVALALYNLILAFVFYKKYGLDKNAIYVLLGITLSFVTLAIPIQFEGNHITLFWAAEAVVLFWLARKSKITTLNFSAIAVQFLMLISLFMDWDFYYLTYSKEVLTLITNPIFITGIVCLASLIGSFCFFKSDKENNFYNLFTFENRAYRSILIMTSVFVAYFVGLFEVFYQSHFYIANETSAFSLSVLYHFLFSAILIYFSLKKKELVAFSLSLALFNILIYIGLYYNLSFQEMTNNFAGKRSSQIAFITHYLLLICLFYFGSILYSQRNSVEYSKYLNHKLALWILAFFGVYILSNEVMIHSLKFSEITTNIEFLKSKINYSPDFYGREIFYLEQASLMKTQIIKIGYPILWGIISFVLLILGIKRQNKQLRIIALSLLGLTTLKLFLYDIRNVSETGKIIAFILLGVLILIISFVYQKLKRLVTEDANNSKPQDEA